MWIWLYFQVCVYNCYSANESNNRTVVKISVKTRNNSSSLVVFLFVCCCFLTNLFKGYFYSWEHLTRCHSLRKQMSSNTGKDVMRRGIGWGRRAVQDGEVEGEGKRWLVYFSFIWFWMFYVLFWINIWNRSF